MDEDGEIDSELQFDDQGNKKAPRRHHPRMDIVSKLLSIVETQALMGENCNPGSDLNLGEKVVNRYAQVSLYFQILKRYLYVQLYTQISIKQDARAVSAVTLAKITLAGVC